jgi:tetratricopeptide (TPR) repeat protein
MPGVGQETFDTLSTEAQFLAKLGKEQDAKAEMRQALNLPAATAIQIHLFGRQLLAEHKNAEAMEVFQLNAKRNGDAWPVHVGLARGYSALGDLKQALEHARKALPQAPDPANQAALKAMIETLASGKPI